MDQEPGGNLDNDEMKHSWDNWEKQESNSFIYQVQNGRKGLNAGLENGLQGINRYLYGTQRGRYYLIGADSGVGKTTVADFMYVLSTWMTAKKQGKKIKIFYCSFELAKIDKVARWVSFYVFLKTGKCIPSEYILGRIDGLYVTEAEIPIIMEGYRMVNEMMKDVIMVDAAVHPTKVFEDIIHHHYEKEGTVVRAAIPEAEARKGKKGHIIKYLPHDPTAYTLLVIDHLGLLQPEMGLSLKNTMDKMSRYCIILRNLFQTTCIVVQQFSTDLLQHKRERMDRLTGKQKEATIMPTRLDFGDSKATYRDADVVIGLVKPIVFDLDEFMGINTSRISHGGMGDYCLVAGLMKNRYGASNKIFPLFLNPIAGVAQDLPTNLDADYDPWLVKAKELNDIVQHYQPKSN
jgi:hypothetical protein